MNSFDSNFVWIIWNSLLFTRFVFYLGNYVKHLILSHITEIFQWKHFKKSLHVKIQSELTFLWIVYSPVPTRTLKVNALPQEAWMALQYRWHYYIFYFHGNQFVESWWSSFSSRCIVSYLWNYSCCFVSIYN